jgi:hypothetical protein
MTRAEFITDEVELATLRRNCQTGARLLFAGHDCIMDSYDPLDGLHTFVKSLQNERKNNTVWSMDATEAVYRFWTTFSTTMDISYIRVMAQEQIELLLHDESLFGRSVDEIGEALFYYYQAPGWHDLTYELAGSEGPHALKSELLRGGVIMGSILARWHKVDDAWAVSGNAVRAWLHGDDKSPGSARALVARVDETLDILARTR